MYIYIYTYTHIHTYKHVHVYTYVYAYVYTYLYTYVYTYVYTYIRTYIHTCVYIYIYIYIHVYTYIHVYIHDICSYLIIYHWRHVCAFCLYLGLRPGRVRGWRPPRALPERGPTFICSNTRVCFTNCFISTLFRLD